MLEKNEQASKIRGVPSVSAGLVSKCFFGGANTREFANQIGNLKSLRLNRWRFKSARSLARKSRKAGNGNYVRHWGAESTLANPACPRDQVTVVMRSARRVVPTKKPSHSIV